MRSGIVAAVMLVALGCSGDDETETIVPPTGCAGGEWLRADGVCVAAGLPPDMPCAPAEWQREDGACIPAGVPPDGCGEGFAHDGDRGCAAILPDAPCTAGLMAVPGETTCREIAPCASGTWGGIPVETDTEYVDASYAGMDSDGSAQKPWTSVQAAVDAAASGAIVAIAQGSYGDVSVSDHPVRLFGVCPALVAIVGSGAEFAALVVLGGASGTEVHGLTIRGVGAGFYVSNADVVLEHLRVHDNADIGVAANSAGITLRSSLVEANRNHGVFVDASEAAIQGSIVRGTLPDAGGKFGRGIAVQSDEIASTLSMSSSIVEANREIGVFLGASQATVEASVIRDTRVASQGFGGRAVSVQPHPITGAPSSLSLDSSIIAQSSDTGIYVEGSAATLEKSVVRETLMDAMQRYGRGLTVQSNATTGAPSTLVVGRSLIEEQYELGIYLQGSNASIDASAIRDTLPNADGWFGRGIGAQASPMTGGRSTLAVRTSLIAQNHQTGIFLASSDATVDACVVRDTWPNAHGVTGRGVNLEIMSSSRTPSTLLMHASVIEGSHEAGVEIISSTATIDACIIRDTKANPVGAYGEGVLVLSHELPASATITATRVERSALAAVAAWGAHAAIGGSALSCQAYDLDSESHMGAVAAFEDLGGNVCGCPEPNRDCKAVSAGLEPPQSDVPVPE